MGYLYAKGKLEDAVYNMAIGSGTIQERLLAAHRAFSPLNDSDIEDEDILADWQSIKRRMMSLKDPAPEGDPGRIGDVPYTLAHMSDEDAVRVATDLCNLCTRIKHRMHDLAAAEQRNKTP